MVALLLKIVACFMAMPIAFVGFWLLCCGSRLFSDERDLVAAYMLLVAIVCLLPNRWISQMPRPLVRLYFLVAVVVLLPFSFVAYPYFSCGCNSGALGDFGPSETDVDAFLACLLVFTAPASLYLYKLSHRPTKPSLDKGQIPSTNKTAAGCGGMGTVTCAPQIGGDGDGHLCPVLD